MVSSFLRHFFTLMLIFSLWACTQGGEFIGSGLDGGGAMDQGIGQGGPLGGSNAAPTIPEMGADSSEGTVVQCECGKDPWGKCVEPCGPSASSDIKAPDDDDDPEPPPPSGGSFKMMQAPDPDEGYDDEEAPLDPDEAYEQEYEANSYL